MSPYFFRVEHDLLRSPAFRALGGSAIKVYLVIGLYSDFGTDWAYPSIRTIAHQAGLSRQTVLAAVEELTRMGLLATSKAKGRSTAYRIIRQAPDRSREKPKRTKKLQGTEKSGPKFLEEGPLTGPLSLEETPTGVPTSIRGAAQYLGRSGPQAGPERELDTSETTTSIPIPGTPFRLSAEGRLLVAVDLQELLTTQGIPRQLAERLAAQKAPEDVAKVLLNAFYLQSQGKLQNGPGYIRAGLEGGYELLPQVANQLENRRRELAGQLRTVELQRERLRKEEQRMAQETAINLVIEHLSPGELDALIREAVASLPEPIVRRNPTLSNPFVRGKVYELAGGEPIA
jgi:hypothetical protein